MRTRISGRVAVLPFTLFLTCLLACQARSAAGVPAERPDRQSELRATRTFLDDNTPRFHEAIRRARGWLDGLEVDPAALRAQGIKGKKKFTEQLDAYVRLYLVAPPSEREALLERIRKLEARTREPGYHDMLQVDDETFKEDSTSYLRAAYLLGKAGLDTSGYRAEIAKIERRLNQHMAGRGAHQRMVFAWYYAMFGLKEPFPLAEGYKGGVIASRKSPYEMSPMEIYSLTHEIFVPYQFGDKLDADFFGAEDLKYLRWALERLTVGMLMRRDADLTAELVSCLRYLHFTDVPVYREALEFLLRTQRPDGTWGSYERYRQTLGDYVEQDYYLHTTMVTMEALIDAFVTREDARPQSRP